MLSREKLQHAEGRRKTASGHRPEKSGLVRVILVSETPNCLSRLLQHLEIRDCWYGITRNYGEARSLIRKKGCNFLIGPAPLPPGTVSSLASLLTTRGSSFFCVQAVEAGCWWLPVYLRGELCLGMPALRPGEFVKLFDTLVEEIRHAQADPQPSRQAVATQAMAAG